ncbi:hypothetical protein MHD_00755 [Mannheimia granulomatis]|uniref:Transposase IS200 n=1 Tax=Mannheimia granulomatis TaxID=85402 RepID=A0A011NC79_9PAST|nr:IS200/IS605 family transposase [Mannheimia granulomatis]EXI61965.1 transposase IS200 [Mannheimia granulomatis]RGE49366.1 hypothetical protein MHD_00755 [Mannheimia granulomatis]
MSYTRLIYHIVFRTKYGTPTISEQHETSLYRYINGYVSSRKAKLYQINGMPDHLHPLVGLPPTIAVSDFVQQLKNATHLFMEQNHALFPDFFAWSKGYCALTYSEQEKAKIANYIKHQKSHHKQLGFADEIKQLMVENGLYVDEAYFSRNL